VTRDQIRAVVADLRDVAAHAERSPGRLAAHYAPEAPVRLGGEASEGEVMIAFGPAGGRFNLSPTGDLTEAAANLFAMLRAADRLAPTAIVVAPVPDQGLGEAINDRLRRAAGFVG
jgi:L-threonylcarbamoyladenylate synthase